MTDAEINLLATRMMRVFQGNKEGHYVADFRNVTIEKGGKRVPIYKDVRGPLTLEEFVAHIRGYTGLLVVPLTASGACRWGKIDIDDYEGDPVERAKKWWKLIKRMGLPLIPELSKSGGIQLAHYSPFNESAEDMRAKLADWCAALHIKPGTELFPKQGRLMPGEVGSGINIPYFGGDGAETRNYAVDEDGRRLTMKEWLDRIENMPATATHVPGEVNVEAAADLLAKHWTEGQRDNLSLAVGGTLLRAGIDTGIVQEILDTTQGIAVDGEKHTSAATIESMLTSGKRVPGYTRLVEIIGKEEAQEFMRLCGAKPPADLVPFEIRSMPAHWADTVPPPVVFAVEPLFPKQVAAVVAAEGGAGKTGFGLAAALSVATGRPFYGLPVTQGIAVYIALEENENSLWRRFHKIIGDEVMRMQREGLSPDRIAQFHTDHQANLFPVAGAGFELHLIRSVHGDVGVSDALIERLIEKMPPSPTFVTIDPVARAHGTEENANHVSTALINAGERIAQRTGAAFVYMHHVSKDAIRNRDTSMNAARGGSALIAGARSSIRLAPVTDGRIFNNVPPEVIAAGDLIEVIHNKLNDGKKCAPFYLRRQELSFERFEPQVSTQALRQSQALAALFNWYVNNERKGFSQNTVSRSKEQRETVFRFEISRDSAVAVVQSAVEAGHLVKSEETPPNSDVKLLKFREDFEIPM
jgi:RecA-family ATPase